MLKLLSHKLSVRSPVFAGGRGLEITPLKEIEKGGTSNSYVFSLPNHLGTHIDAPRHFDPRGRAISSFSLQDLLFTRPVLVDIPKGESELISKQDLRPFSNRIAGTDMLLIRTGFQRHRDTNPHVYSNRNPGISVEAAREIAEKFSTVRALGLDFISASAAEWREEGREAHRALLVGRDFLIVEDMDLSSWARRVKYLLVIPWMIEGIDSAPCAVIAEV